jgi:Mce-associated membrane protein
LSVTEEPRVTEEPDAAEEPEATDEPGMAEEPEATDEPDAAEDAEAAAEPAATGAGPGAEARRRRWIPRPWVLVLVLTLVFVLGGAGLQVLSARTRHDPALADRALVDTEATSVVIGDVSNGLTKIFSYAPDSTAATEQAAAEVLSGTAAREYRTLFAQVKQHAAAERLTVTTRVVRAGVVRLTRDTAQLLVFLDQVIVRKDRPKGMSAAAQLAVTARRQGGRWRIVDMHAR